MNFESYFKRSYNFERILKKVSCNKSLEKKLSRYDQMINSNLKFLKNL